MENNKLIAEFMGHSIFDGINYYEPKDMKFHKDWNELIPVIEKIYNTDLYYSDYINYNSSMFSSGKIEFSTDIKNVFQQCVEFIKWYNKN